MTDSPAAGHPAESVLRPSEAALRRAWRELVEAHEAQAERLREEEPPADPWGATRVLSADRSSPPEILGLLDDKMSPDETWLDIGAGAGRFSIHLAKRVGRVVTVDPSPGMTARLREAVADAGLGNVEVLEPAAWPPREPPAAVDVTFAAHVIYFVSDIGAFLDAMEASARRRCIVVVSELGTPGPVEPLFTEVHGEPYIRLPALRELLALLSARRRSFDVRAQRTAMAGPQDAAAALNFSRGRYLVREGSEKERRLRDLLLKRDGAGDGTEFASAALTVGGFRAVVSWAPPDST